MAMPVEAFPQHPRPWTLDEVLALADGNGQRIELVDGIVVVSPAPTPAHQRLLHRLQIALNDAVPAELELLPGVNVVLNSRRLVIPDLVVTNAPGHTGQYFDSEQIVLAVEILSPSSRAYDQVLKRQLYAEAAVPYYLVIEPSEPTPSAVLFRLDGDGYGEMARSVEGLLRLERPIRADVQLG